MKNDAEEESKIVIENSGGDSVSDSITNILKEGILRAFTEKVQRGEIAIEDLEQRIQKFLVCTGNPQSIVACHSLITHEYILKCFI